ncbi:MAG TPA: UdgX family uracil-DNA binding protein [Pyrinomonadaceae bacterium]|jgi:DNA polymerase|nr:UdgX family uracil-DNA binding protein [Pyrinomonadaceae bacterium]
MPELIPRSALDFFPSKITYTSLNEASFSCKGCDLYKLGTQTVFGEGPRDAKLMMVGEQPGNDEDLEGHPFVGPAGKLLDRALDDAGIDRKTVYMTNAVKHFKWKPAGKRRLHQKPNAGEVAACKPWLDAEIEVIHPEILVCLGATAAQALLGKAFRVTKSRGEWFDLGEGQRIIATIHPSAILRTPDIDREQEYRNFVKDLMIAAKAV